jgi:aldose 1-epimerase
VSLVFPARLIIAFATHFCPARRCSIEFSAAPQKATHLNIAHHSYFNLAGHDAGSIEDHMVQVNADKYLETDEDFIPTGKMLAVQGTPLDLRDPTLLRRQAQLQILPRYARAGASTSALLLTMQNPTTAEGIEAFCARVDEPRKQA